MGEFLVENGLIKNSITVQDTKVVMCEVVKPIHLNDLRQFHVSQLLEWMDLVACMSAEKFTLKSCVTVCMDDMILKPIQFVPHQYAVLVQGQLNACFKTSMEVGVNVQCENLISGEIEHVCSAYFTFCILKSTEAFIMPILHCTTNYEKYQNQMAKERKLVRMHRSKQIKISNNENNNINNILEEIKTNSMNNVDNMKYSMTTYHLVLPSDANHMSSTFGGKIMNWMCDSAYIVATRYSKQIVSLIGIDDIFFISSSKVGDRIIMKTQLNRVFGNTMEIGIRVESISNTSNTLQHINSAYLLFQTQETLKPFVPTTLKQYQTYQRAGKRREIRLLRHALYNQMKMNELEISIHSNLQWSKDYQLQRDYILYNIKDLLQLAYLDDTKWDILYTEPNKVLIREILDQNVVCFKISMRIQQKMNRIFSYLLNISNRKEWDTLCQEISILETIDNENDILYQIYQQNQSMFEFVLLRSYRQLPNQCVIALQSIQYDPISTNQKTNQKQYHRGCILPSGFVLTPIKEQETQLSYYLQLSGSSISMAIHEINSDIKIMDNFERLKIILEALDKTRPISNRIQRLTSYLQDKLSS